MIVGNSSDLIAALQHIHVNEQLVAIATLINGTALVVAPDSMSLYRSVDKVGDELGNGLIASVRLPITLTAADGVLILEHKAGYVGLADGYVLLITLNDVQLFANKNDALRNQHEIVRLSLAH